MKIGDKVRFLNEVGGGVVTGFPQKNMVTVRCDDGFEIPMLQKECVVIDTNEYNIAKVHTITPAPEKKPKGQDSGNPSSTYPKTKKASETIFDEEDTADRPITFRPKPFERREGESLNIKLAFLPSNIKELSTTTFETYLINDSNYYVDFCYLSAENEAWTVRFRGTAEPNTKIFLEEFGYNVLNNLEHVCLQMFAYKEEKTFLLKPSMSVRLRIDGTKFYRLNSFKESDFFEEPTLLYDVVINDSPVRPTFVDAKEIQESLQQKRQIDLPHPHTPHKEKKKEGPLEIDLHASELLESTAGMKPGEILEYQLDVFRKTMNENRTSKGKKIVFIHGKGEGVLRQALLKELKQKYRSCSYQDASFREYGFGATMVTIH